MKSPGSFFKALLPLKMKRAIKESGIYRLAQKRRYIARMQPWITLKEEVFKKPGFSRRMGVNLIGFLNAELGLGYAARGSELALRTAGIPLQLININIPNSKEKTGDNLGSSPESYGLEDGINLIHINPPEYPLVWKQVDKAVLAGGYNIGVWYWELPKLPDEWRQGFGVLDEIWAASGFIQETIAKESPIPVIKIPPCVQVELNNSLKRSDFNLPEDVFLFLNAYDTHSVSERKNPLAAVQAFLEAFPGQEAGVGLVIKVSNAEDDPQAMTQIKQAFEDRRNCYLIEEALPKVKFNSLISLVDGCISLHRSEGFGLFPAEAMYLGKPVIATNWSGNTDFMTPENSCPVDYQLIPVKPGLPHYHAGQVWAEADVAQAAGFMKRLTGDDFYYNKISEKARATILQNFSPQKIGDMMNRRLEEIK